MKWELLLVDDEVCLLDLLAELLQEDDINVTKAKNGKEALELLKVRPFDVVVSDVNMPLMDGPAMLEAARNEGIFVPTIFFSAQSRFSHPAAVAIVMKPNFERLSTELNSVLTRKELSAEIIPTQLFSLQTSLAEL